MIYASSLSILAKASTIETPPLLTLFVSGPERTTPAS